MGERERGNIRAPRTDVRSSHFRHRIPAFMVAACFALGASAPRVQAVPLSSLQGGGSIQQADKLFTNFSATVTGTDNDAVNLNLIDVVGYTSPSGEHGIVFKGSPTGPPMISVDPGLFVDLLIRFDVFVLDPLFDIDDLTLSFVASAPNDGHAQVVETALAGDPVVVAGQTFVSTPIPNVTTSHIDLAGQYHQIHIVKDVAVIAGANVGASISEITQTFSQVPEPASLALLGIGSLLMIRRRRTALLPAFASLALLLNAGSASAIPLQTLVNTQDPIVESDKTFDNFAVVISDQAGNWIFDPNSINVATRTQGQDVYLTFEGLFAALSTVQTGSKVTVTIDFDVLVTDATQRISSLGLFFNGQPLSPVDGSAQVVETVTAGGPPIATLNVANPPGVLIDSENLPAPPPAYTALHVSKRITVDGGEASISTISIIEQRFTQVPEPVTLAGLLLGLPLVLHRRRHA